MSARLTISMCWLIEDFTLIFKQDILDELAKSLNGRMAEGEGRGEKGKISSENLSTILNVLNNALAVPL